VNKLAVDDTYGGPEGETSGWKFGLKMRARGSIHSDIWSGSAADLADMNSIAVFPVGGWWKYKTGEEKWKETSRFSLLVSIDVPENSTNIYSVVESQTSVDVLVDTNIYSDLLL